MRTLILSKLGRTITSDMRPNELHKGTMFHVIHVEYNLELARVPVREIVLACIRYVMMSFAASLFGPHSDCPSYELQDHGLAHTATVLVTRASTNLSLRGQVFLNHVCIRAMFTTAGS